MVVDATETIFHLMILCLEAGQFFFSTRANEANREKENVMKLSHIVNVERKVDA